MNIQTFIKIKIFFIVLFFSLSSRADHASPSFETGAAGAIMTSPGATLPEKEIVLGASFQLIELDDISDAGLEVAGAAEQDVHSVDSLLSVSVNIAYGVTDDLTLGVSFPYVERDNVREAHHDETTGMGEAEVAGDSSGIGDLNLFGQYRFYHSPDSDYSIIAGFKAPTGDTDERELEGGLFETEQQPGSGSWDPFFGLAFNRSFDQLGVSGNVLYTIINEGTQQTDLGDIFNYNVALSYRIFSPEGGHDHHSHQHGFNFIDYVDTALEFNGYHRERVDINGETEENSGGHTLYISPGVRIGIAHQWSFYTSAGIPVINDQNGIQSDPDFRVIGGFSFIF